MSTHQTIFCHFCRVIASQTRLQLLWEIFRDQEQCVQDLAIRTGISESNVSNQLQILAEKGLIAPKREKQKAFYRPATQNSSEYAKNILPALKKCHAQEVPHRQIIQHATAFTHERRIQIVRCLVRSEETFESLLKKTGMTVPALNRHLRKLLQRNVIQKNLRAYQLVNPRDRLARHLLKLATKPAGDVSHL